jgi:prepilin-type N-terminal cleavage/methylation domain-containing protein
MINQNNRGFSLVEIMLVVAVAGLIGLICWGVISMRAQSISPPTKSSDQTVGQGKGKDSELLETVSFDTPDGWSQSSDMDSEDASSSVVLKAPNTAKSGDGEYDQVLVSGAEIFIYQGKSSINDIDGFISGELATRKSSGWIIKDEKRIKVGGKDALQYYGAFEGAPAVEVVVISNGQKHTFSIEASAYEKDEYKNIFDTFLTSVSFR